MVLWSTSVILSKQLGYDFVMAAFINRIIWCFREYDNMQMSIIYKG